MWTSAWKKNYSYRICEIYSDNLAVCLYIKFFLLLVVNRECMEHNVMTSFRILSSFECFLRYFQTEWSVFFTLQCELFTSCNVSSNASLVSARTGGGVVGGQPNVYRPGQGERGSENSQICADILYGWPHVEINTNFFLYYLLFSELFSTVNDDIDSSFDKY